MIKVGDVYKTKRGGSARIVCTDVQGVGKYPVLGLVSLYDGGYDEYLIGYNLKGESSSPHNLLILPPPNNVPQDTPVDTKVWVRDSDSSPWIAMHLECMENSSLCRTWGEGRTSFTSGYAYSMVWNFSRLASDGNPNEGNV